MQMPVRMCKAALILALFGGLAGCGGGGSSSANAVAPAAPSTPPAQTGEVAVAVTDAEGDFLVYEVEVVRIELTRQDGGAVQVIPASSRIDFADLTELSELLTVATVPAATYASIDFVVDFDDAVVMVQDDAGEIREATLQDADGDPLGEQAVSLRLDEAQPLRVGPGTIARVSLDFDLDASNEILSFDPAVVAVSPFVLASAEFDETRDLRIQGVLQAVDADDVVSLEVRPWRRRPAMVGEASFVTDDETIWEIDDAALVGAAGLEALRDVAVGTALAVRGEVIDGRLTADTVLAGTAVPGVGGDVLAGTVLGREGDTLTLGGVRVHAAAGPDRFLRRATLVVDASTMVIERANGGAEAQTDAVLSVASQVIAPALELAPATESEPVAFDGTGATVALRRSALTAEVASADPLVVDLVTLSGRRPGAYDFAGTGSEMATDADPAAYEIDLGVLSADDLEPGELIRVRGLVADFGAAPADFAAESLIDVASDSRAARLRANWASVGGTTTALSAISDGGFELDLSDASASLRVRGVLRNVLPEDGTVRIEPAADGPMLFTLQAGDAGEILIHESFDSFAAGLLDGLDEGASIAGLTVEGRYDRGLGVLEAQRVRVRWSS